MDIQTLSFIFGWCAIINMAFTLFWLGAFMLMPKATIKLQQKAFNIDKNSILKYNYLLIGLFKILNILFFVTPWLVLQGLL